MAKRSLTRIARTSGAASFALLAGTAVLPAAAQAHPLPTGAAAAASASSPPDLTYSILGRTRGQVNIYLPETSSTQGVASAARFTTTQGWSDQTGRVYYVRQRTPGSDVTDLDSVAGTGGSPRTEIQDVRSFDMTADGSLVVFERGDGQLYKAAGIGGTPVRLTGAGGGEPRLSADGTKIAFTRTTRVINGGIINDSNLEVYVLKIDGTGLKRITGADNDDVAGPFSPDGKRLLFTRYDAGKGIISSVYAVNTDGTNLRLVARDGAYPDWSTTGWIVYAGYRRGGADAQDLYQLAPGISSKPELSHQDNYPIDGVRFKTPHVATPAASSGTTTSTS